MIVQEYNKLIESKVTLDQFHSAFKWKVEKENLYIQNGLIDVPGFFATVRVNEDGTKTPLGVVKGRYEVIENSQVLEAVEKILGVGAGVPYDYQVQNHGARFAFRLLFPKYLAPNVNDKSNFLQLCLSVKGSHDGSSGLVVELSPILRYCLNGLLNLGKAHAVSSVRHSSGASLKLDRIKTVFGLVEEEFDTFGLQLGRLSEVTLNRIQIRDYVKNVLGVTESDDQKISTRTRNVIADIESLAIQGRGNHGETLWDAYQGVTEYVDHYRGEKGSRGWNSVAGTGASLKREALKVALELSK